MEEGTPWRGEGRGESPSDGGVVLEDGQQIAKSFSCCNLATGYNSARSILLKPRDIIMVS